MPRRRRLLTPMKRKVSNAKILRYDDFEKEGTEVTTPRGRLKGALKDALEPGYESDSSVDNAPMKRESRYLEPKYVSDESSNDEENHKMSSQRYVLKLFDRSVDLSQFDEDSPLYPICRAWIANQPKMNYKKFGKKKHVALIHKESVELPGPEGPPVSRIPDLLPEQKAVSKDNINLDYESAPPPAPALLLAAHCARWGGVRRAWSAHTARVEARYDAAQQLLNKINVNGI